MFSVALMYKHICVREFDTYKDSLEEAILMFFLGVLREGNDKGTSLISLPDCPMRQKKVKRG